MPIYWEYFKAKTFFVIFVNMGRPGDPPPSRLKSPLFTPTGNLNFDVE